MPVSYVNQNRWGPLPWPHPQSSTLGLAHILEVINLTSALALTLKVQL